VAAEKERLLSHLGHRVKKTRALRGLTRRALAQGSGVSERFIAEVESGRANISIGKLLEIAGALDLSLARLLEEPVAEPKSVIALLGLRGAGKSSVGKKLAARLRLPFFELDRLVEAKAGMGLSEIFAIHDEDYFRSLELEALRELFQMQRKAVIAVGGGIVGSAEAFEMLRQNARTIWLKARPEEHWDRVVAQGDLRPMQNRPQAMAELKRRLKEREPLYSQAEFTCSTSERSIASVVAEIEQHL
jgi:XRE family aerobic/anaerobic benzoate catabolism transcriptional regulator